MNDEKKARAGAISSRSARPRAWGRRWPGWDSRPGIAARPGEARSQFQAKRPCRSSRSVSSAWAAWVRAMSTTSAASTASQIKAICDIVPAKVERAQKRRRRSRPAEADGLLAEARPTSSGCARPKTSTSSITATPWEWHVPVCVAAMKNGKHAATEVPAAMTLDDCWALVETAEKCGKHCLMMENCCYDRIEMMMLNMVRKGLFGEVLHAEGGYLHDLRERQVRQRRARACGGGPGREKLNGNLYPTHGLGPVAQCMNINRGDRVRLPRLDERPVARPARVRRRRPSAPTRRRRKEKYALGDVNTSLIKTKLGKTIILHPRHEPAAAVQPDQPGAGHEGHRPKWPDRIYVEGQADEAARMGRFRELRAPSSSIRSGRHIALEGRRPRATAAWTSSRITA